MYFVERNFFVSFRFKLATNKKQNSDKKLKLKENISSGLLMIK